MRRLQDLLGCRRCRLLSLLQAALALVLASCTLQILGYRKTLGLMQRSCRHRRPADLCGSDAGDFDDAANAVQRAARLFRGRITCLPRACALYWLLVWRGWPAHIRFGVRRGRNGLDAHAWVEIEGVPVGERHRSDPTFAPLCRTANTATPVAADPDTSGR